MIRNIHERRIVGDGEMVGELLNSLATPHDRLWPQDQWPPMRFDRTLGVGAVGGHGPVRYFVDEFEPGRSVRFRFLEPVGFHGHHSFTLAQTDEVSVLLRHELAMTVPRVRLVRSLSSRKVGRSISAATRQTHGEEV